MYKIKWKVNDFLSLDFTTKITNAPCFAIERCHIYSELAENWMIITNIKSRNRQWKRLCEIMCYKFHRWIVAADVSTEERCVVATWPYHKKRIKVVQNKCFNLCIMYLNWLALYPRDKKALHKLGTDFIFLLHYAFRQKLFSSYFPLSII